MKPFFCLIPIHIKLLHSQKFPLRKEERLSWWQQCKKIEWMKTRIVKYLISFMSWLSFLCMEKSSSFYKFFQQYYEDKKKNDDNIHAVNVSRPHIEQIVTQHTTMELSNNSIISWYQLIHISLALFTSLSDILRIMWWLSDCLKNYYYCYFFWCRWMNGCDKKKSIFVFGIHMWGFFSFLWMKRMDEDDL